jgi:ankyrin repeat protein
MADPPLAPLLKCPICAAPMKTQHGFRHHLRSDRHNLSNAETVDLLDAALKGLQYNPFSGELAKPVDVVVKTLRTTRSIATKTLGLVLVAEPHDDTVVLCKKVARKSPLYSEASVLTDSRVVEINGTAIERYEDVTAVFRREGHIRPMTFTFEHTSNSSELFFANKFAQAEASRAETELRTKVRSLPECFGVVRGISERTIEEEGLAVVSRTLSPHLEALREAKDRHGSNALHFAAGDNAPIAVLEYLIDVAGLGVNSINIPKSLHGSEEDAKNHLKGSFGRSPIHWASRNGNLEVARYLVERGADAKLTTPDGTTTVMWAMWHAHVEVTKFLVEECGVSLFDENTFGCNVCHFIGLSGCVDSMAYYIASGGDAKKTNVQGHNILHKAAWKGNVRLMEFLCEKGGLGAEDFDKVDSRGFKPIDVARLNGEEATVAWIEEKVPTL